jgi:Arc/MetJ-type ribon-helix-helix transcriptional regulator
MAEKSCTCNHDASQSSSHTLRTLARSASSVVAGRITNATAKALGRYCSDHSCTQSEALRTALTLLSASSDDPQATLAAVATALGLPEGADADDVQSSIEDLVKALSAVPDDPSAQGADTPPAPQFTSLSGLSAHERVALSDRYGVKTDREYQALKRNIVPRTPAKAK